MLWLALVASASAHRPHAVIKGLAARADLERSGRAWAVLDPSANSMLLRTDDGGRHWDFEGGDPQVDTLVGIAYLGRTLVVLGDNGDVWSSPDEGETWAHRTLGDGITATEIVATDDRVAIATSAGVWRGSLAELQVIDPATAFAEVAFDATDPTMLVARTLDGQILRLAGDDTDAQGLPAFPNGEMPSAIAEIDGVTYAGFDGGVLRNDGGVSWSTCGDIPFTTGSHYPSLVANLTGVSTGALMAATGDQAYYESDDGCATWRLVDSGQQTAYGGIGAASNADEAYTALVAMGDERIVAGFNGVSSSTDAGRTWTFSPIIPADYCRGLFFGPGYPEDPFIAFGTYGGGPAWSMDGGATWTGTPAGNMQAIYAQEMGVDPEFETTGTMWWSGRPNPPAVSHDRGLTWTSVDAGYDGVRAIEYVGDEVWALGDVEQPSLAGRVSVSRDGGEHWTVSDSASAAMGAALPNEGRRGDVNGTDETLLLVDAPTKLFASEDGGGSWRQIYAGPAGDERAAGVEIWDSRRIVFGSLDGGLALSDDNGESWRVPTTPPDERPRVLIAGDDGELFVAGSGGQMYRSEDGGETWTAVGDRLAPGVHVMDASPDFARTRSLLAGTEAGLFWSNDAGDSWHRLPRYQRFETGSYHLTCTGICQTYGGEDATSIIGWTLVPGDTVSFSFRGHAFHLIGEGSDDAGVTVNINGHDVTTLGASDLTLDDLTEAWQDVTIGLSSGVLQLDAVEAYGEGDVIPVPLVDPGDSGVDSGDTAAADPGTDKPASRCGCAATGGTAGWMGIFAGVVALRRRTRGSQSAGAERNGS